MGILGRHESIFYYFEDHSSPKVGHIFLRECKPRPPTNIFGKLAGEHPTVRPIHLLRDRLGDHLGPVRSVQWRALLVLVFLLQVGSESRQTSLG